MTTKFTVQDLATRFGTNKQVAYGFLKFMEAVGLVTKAESLSTPGKKGKKQSVYEVSNETLVFLDAGVRSVVSPPVSVTATAVNA